MTRGQRTTVVVGRLPPVRQPLVSRADLVRIRAAFPDETRELLAELAGWERRAAPRVEPPRDMRGDLGQQQVPVGDLFKPDSISEPNPVPTPGPEPTEESQERPRRWPEQAEAVRFWMPVAHTPEKSLFVIKPPRVTGKLEWRNAPQTAPKPIPLSRWPVLGPRLRAVFADLLRSGELDVDRTVERIAAAQRTDALVFRPWKRWGSAVQVLVDRSFHLMPYFDDQELVVKALRRLLGRGRLEVCWGFGCDLSSYGRTGPLTDPWRPYEPAVPGTRVLVLGDLGCLDQSVESVAHWRGFGEELRQRGCQPIALVPCDLSRIDRPLRDVFRVRGWGMRETGTAAISSSKRAQLVRRLLQLFSYCVRVEPGLLRACRHLLAAAGDPGLESDAWQDEFFVNRTSEAAEPGPSPYVESLIREFETLPAELRRQAVLAVQRWRPQGHIGCEIHFEELSRLSTATRELLDRSDWDDTVAGWTYLSQYAASHRATKRSDPVLDYARRLDYRLSPSTLLNPDVGKLASDLRRQLAAAEGGTGQSTNADRVTVLQVGNDFFARGESDTLAYEALPPRAKRVASLRTVGGVLHVIPHVAATADGVADATPGIPPRQLAVGEQWRFSIPACVSVTLRTDAESVRLESRERPEWADAWGMDGYGVWADLWVRDVVVRWRWIAPGSFLMGSPESEPGRDSDEGPQHWVTLTRGFWMMATPCTQQLWTALMPNNPSRFQDPERPVEQVSWNDVAQFVERLNNHDDPNRQRGPESSAFPPSVFRLPTEAQWEYACRAGSPNALYRVPGSTGQIMILGEHNAPALDPIAWYGGNSGVGFELEDGWDSHGWPEKQFPHRLAGSRPVARKQPNMWGLHDMLGDVWEWCWDGKRTYTAESVDDPGEEAADMGSRCVRGGGWLNRARIVRCAYRGQGGSEGRSENLGFRLVRVQDRS